MPGLRRRAAIRRVSASPSETATGRLNLTFSKTGSSSYLLWPARVGAFTAVIGKHYTNFDTRNLPFSYIDDRDGRSVLYPALNLSTVGTKRDGEKWRDAAESDWLAEFRHISVDAMMALIRGDLEALGIEQAVFTSERAMVEAGMVDAVVERIRGEVDFEARCLATGGLARLFAGQSKAIEETDEMLTLRGLKILFERNR